MHGGKLRTYAYGFLKLAKTDALTGNRTQVPCMASKDSTTEPPMPYGIHI